MSLLTSIAPAFTRRPARAAAADSSGESLPGVRPAYEVTETPDAYSLTVRLPGVARDGLDFTADSAEIRIEGKRAWRQPEVWTTVYRETSERPFRLVLSHEAALDVDRIHADLRDGVLRVSLPKAEALKPRKITVS